MPAEPEAYRHKRNLYKMIPQLSRSHRCINRWMKTHLRNHKGQRTWQRSPQLDLKLPVLILKPVAHRAQKRARCLVQTPLKQGRDHSLDRAPARRPAQVATVRLVVAVGTVAADLERSWIWYKYSGVSLYRSPISNRLLHSRNRPVQRDTTVTLDESLVERGALQGPRSNVWHWHGTRSLATWIRPWVKELLGSFVNVVCQPGQHTGLPLLVWSVQISTC